MSVPHECSIAPAVASPAEDRRDSARVPCQLTGKARPCTALEASNQWPVKVSDISAGGVGVVACRRFEPGTLLALTLAGPAADEVAMPLARVRRVTTQGVYWLLGCTWMDELEPADMNLLLGHRRDGQPAPALRPK